MIAVAFADRVNQDVGQEQATIDGSDLVMLLTLVGWTLSTTLATALDLAAPVVRTERAAPGDRSVDGTTVRPVDSCRP